LLAKQKQQFQSEMMPFHFCLDFLVLAASPSLGVVGRLLFDTALPLGSRSAIKSSSSLAFCDLDLESAASAAPSRASENSST
jgi:hypothetical protein